MLDPKVSSNLMFDLLATTWPTCRFRRGRGIGAGWDSRQIARMTEEVTGAVADGVRGALGFSSALRTCVCL